MPNNYWTATDDYLNSHGGRAPTCPYCGGRMFATDDHGRFSCFCGGRRRRGIVTHDVVSGTVKTVEEERKK